MNDAGDPLAQSCRELARRAAESKTALRAMTATGRRDLLADLAAAVRSASAAVLSANRSDLAAGAGLGRAMLDRLRLDEDRLDSMARAIEAIAAQPDAVGRVDESRLLPSGIRLEKRRVPLGVVLVIYESRPNVTTDAAALCLKSGNAVILRGGSEASKTNAALVEAIRPVLRAAGVPDAAGFVDSPDRAAIGHLVRLEGLIDLAIPRGGPALMKAVVDQARVPVVKHDAGVCHVYVDEHLDGLEDDAERIVVNAKAQRPGVCNAAEKLLIHRGVADRMAPRLCAALTEVGVEIRADPATIALFPQAKQAAPEDWDTEYLDLTITVKIVDSLDAACAHIRRHGSQHTEAIITSSPDASRRFADLIESASVMINCSTRFADGAEYGLGAEIGISTSRLHARGPMGASDLTTWQWLLTGSGQVR